MKRSGFDSRIELLLDFMEKSFGGLAQVRVSVFVEGVEFDDLFVACDEVDVPDDEVPAEVAGD